MHVGLELLAYTARVLITVAAQNIASCLQSTHGKCPQLLGKWVVETVSFCKTFVCKGPYAPAPVSPQTESSFRKT